MHYVDHKKWVASQVPPAKYNNMNVSQIKPKIYAAKIMKPEQPKMPSSWAIPKSKEPGPGAYNTDDAIRLSQWGKVRG